MSDNNHYVNCNSEHKVTSGSWDSSTPTPTPQASDAPRGLSTLSLYIKNRVYIGVLETIRRNPYGGYFYCFVGPDLPWRRPKGNG